MYKDKKVIAFDLDDTLAVAKSPITDKISGLLVRLLEKYEVCIISGGRFEQFQIQVIKKLNASPDSLTQLHIMPTSGTKYYRFDKKINEWELQYEHSLTIDQKDRAIKVLEDGAKELGFWEENPHGEIIEDRDSQITYSALGQQAPSDLKYKWDPNGVKKYKLRDLIAPKLPDLEARVGGTTSVDVTLIGVDKAYGMKKLIKALNIKKSDILFIGDKLQVGGNNYSVKAIGINTIEVSCWEDTALLIQKILGDTK